MRLTFVNFIVRKKPHGYAHRGKHRIVKPVKIEALWNRHDEYQRQERNMFFLRHPYLTVEQSQGAMKELRDSNLTTAPYVKKNNEKFARKFTWAEQLSHLRVKDAWD